MLGTYFYHEILRKTVISFGTLFNDIHVRHEGANGSSISDMKVALAYGPVQKFLARLEQQADLNKATQMSLPRMSFEMNTIQYDASRKSGITQTFKASDGTNLRKVFMPVPYNIGFELNIMTKLNDDALQIVEQILPYFQPDFTVTINAVPDLNIKRDIPIVLGNINYEDNYDGDFTNRRAVIYTLSFTAKTYLYGPMSNQKVIKNVQSDLGASTDSPLTREERIIVVPNPTTADADDDFGFTTSISFYNDGKMVFTWLLLMGAGCRCRLLSPRVSLTL